MNPARTWPRVAATAVITLAVVSTAVVLVFAACHA